MKKVGIMTMQRIVNYGSFLQAYGLKKTIEELGDNRVEFIDYKYEGSLIEKNVKREILNKIVSHLNIIYSIKKRNFLKKFQTEYNEYLKKMNISDYNYNKNIDTLVIGSDEVFNCLQPYPVGYSRNFFGKEYEKTKVISYAASFGDTDLSGLKKYNVDIEIGNMLNKFKSISVRDENSYKLVKKITNVPTIINLDPVLISDYENEINNSIMKDISNYIIVYAYTGRLTKEEEKYILKFAKKYNKKIVCLGNYQKIADYNLIVEPFSVLKYFKNADFVITDTFHGTVFSIKMNTKFCTIVRESNYNKLNYLLEKFNFCSQKVIDLTDIDKIYNSNISFVQSNKIINDETIIAKEYLNNNI